MPGGPAWAQDIFQGKTRKNGKKQRKTYRKTVGKSEISMVWNQKIGPV
jgi:hypothetical protein